MNNPIEIYVIKFALKTGTITKTIGELLPNSRADIVWRGSLDGTVIAEPGEFAIDIAVAWSVVGRLPVYVMETDLCKKQIDRTMQPKDFVIPIVGPAGISAYGPFLQNEGSGLYRYGTRELNSDGMAKDEIVTFHHSKKDAVSAAEMLVNPPKRFADRKH